MFPSRQAKTFKGLIQAETVCKWINFHILKFCLFYNCPTWGHIQGRVISIPFSTSPFIMSLFSTDGRKTCLISSPNLLLWIILGCKTSGVPNIETIGNIFHLTVLHPHLPNIREYIALKGDPVKGKLKRAQIRNREGEGARFMQATSSRQGIGFSLSVLLSMYLKTRSKKWDSKLPVPTKIL